MASYLTLIFCCEHSHTFVPSFLVCAGPNILQNATLPAVLFGLDPTYGI